MSSKEPYVVVVWGDSIAAAGWPEKAELVFNNATNKGRRVKVVNMGIGGMPASTAVKQFEERVVPHKPHVVILQFGFNDMRSNGTRDGMPLSTTDEFFGVMSEMIRRCQSELSARVVVFGNHRSRRAGWLLNGKSYEENNAIYREVAKKAAAACGVRYVDMSVETLAGGVGWNEIVNEDGVHLSPTGLFNYAGVAASVIMEEVAKVAD